MKKTICKIAVLLLLLSISLLTFSSCMSHIEDTNGEDDFSLCSLTDEDIAGGGSYLEQGSVRSEINGKVKIRINKFSGVNTIESIKIRGEKKTLTLTATVDSGNFRIVIVKDGEIFADLKVDGTQERVTLSDNGEYDLRIAGESAHIEIVYEIE